MAYSHGHRWSEKEITAALQHMISECKMETMPTHSEIKDFFGNSSLCNAMSKHGGTRYFASKLGLNAKQCESKFGDDFEIACLNQIQSVLKLPCEKTRPRYPYDLLVDRSVKIDVKVSRLFDNYGGSKYSTFNLEKREQTCDIFVLYCIDQDGEIFKNLIVPSTVLSGKCQLSVGKNSVYDKYDGAWEIIKKYNDFFHGDF